MFISYVSCLQLEEMSIFHHQSKRMKTFVFSVNNPICFDFTPVKVLILCLRTLTSDLTPEPLAAIASLNQPLLDPGRLTVRFLTEVRKHHHNVLPLNSHTFCTGQSHLIGDWLWRPTCDLMIVSGQWRLWMDAGMTAMPLGSRVIQGLKTARLIYRCYAGKQF